MELIKGPLPTMEEVGQVDQDIQRAQQEREKKKSRRRRPRLLKNKNGDRVQVVAAAGE